MEMVIMAPFGSKILIGRLIVSSVSHAILASEHAMHHNKKLGSKVKSETEIWRAAKIS